MSQAIRAVPANDADATPVPLPTAPAATVEARVDACRDDVRRLERKLGLLSKKQDEHAASSQRRDEHLRGAVAHGADELARLSSTVVALGEHVGLSGAQIRRDARITRAIALARVPVLLAAGALLLRLFQAFGGH